ASYYLPDYYLLYAHDDHLDLHSFPTRRSSDLVQPLDCALPQIFEQRCAAGTSFERGVAGPLRVVSLADHDGGWGKSKRWMETRAVSVLNTMRRPLAAVRLEMTGDRGMPVPRRIDRQATLDGVVE